LSYVLVMRDQVAEADWKIFRKLREVALERFCERVLSEIDRIRADAGKSHHERYLRTYRLIHRRDKELARAFNNPRRSAMFFQLVALRDQGLLDEKEYLRFSEDIRRSIDHFLRPLERDEEEQE
jgi:hypothetical protein